MCRRVKHIQRIVGGDVKTVGVFTEESDEVLRIMDDCELTYAQLHGGQSEDFARRIGAERVIRVARVKDEEQRRRSRGTYAGDVTTCSIRTRREFRAGRARHSTGTLPSARTLLESRSSSPAA